jgi:arylsulfatase A-like enzyme
MSTHTSNSARGVHAASTRDRARGQKLVIGGSPHHAVKRAEARAPVNPQSVRPLRALAAGIVAVLLVNTSFCAAPAADRPNFIVIFVDNLGNGDVACFHKDSLHRTPNLDRMAAEGTKFTSFYVTAGVCTPSRASLMTGCYAQRVNLHVSGSNTAVLRAIDPKGLHPDEVTIAEVLKQAGYATACIGKWHLGDQPEFLPTRQGFDHYFGIPYSDDMTRDKFPDTWPELPLMRGEEVIEAPPDRDYLVKRCTEETIQFITRNKDRPFFVYLPHTMPGSTPHPFSSPAFRGKSRNGDYGDSVEELDWSTGEILAALKQLGLDEKTLVIWTSDNGAVRRNPPQGSCAPYKGYGYDTSEGAMRMPCIMRWPGRIPAGKVCEEIATTMDLLPTFAGLAGTTPPQGRTIDGHDIRPLLFGERGAKSPYDETGFFYYRIEQLQAVRAGPWKLYLPLEKKFIANNRKTAPSQLELYDLRSDIAEEREVSAQHPDVIKRLLALGEKAREELGDVDRPGKGQRPAGWVEKPTPRVKRFKS